MAEYVLKDKENVNWLCSLRDGSSQAHEKPSKKNNGVDIDEVLNTIEILDELKDVVKNDLNNNDLGILALQQGSLQNEVVRIEAEVVSNILDNVNKDFAKNALTEEDELLTEKEREQYVRDLVLALSAYYLVVIPLFGNSTMKQRANEFNKLVPFKVNNEVKKYVKDLSTKVANSHIDTVIKDISTAIKNAYEDVIDKYFKAQGIDPRNVNDPDLKLARRKALEGATQTEITNSIQNKFTDISKNRAKAIARTETNRAFTQSQYQADLQFIEANPLTDGRKYYKQWVTTNPEPCPTCLDLAKRPPIPFGQPFANMGDTITSTYDVDGKTKVKKTVINFEPLIAGNAHVNCGCRYKLIIKNI